MSIKLSNTQLAMMRAAAQRDDRCFAPSPTLKDGTARKVAAKLIAANLAREIKAKARTPVWRRDADGGEPLALRCVFFKPPTSPANKKIVGEVGARKGSIRTL